MNKSDTSNKDKYNKNRRISNKRKSKYKKFSNNKTQITNSDNGMKIMMNPSNSKNR